MSTDNITTLREELFATLRAVKSGAMELDTARMVNEVSKTIIESARIEVDFIRTTGGGESPFLEAKALPPGVTGTKTHRIAG